jgi:hypothetical protein
MSLSKQNQDTDLKKAFAELNVIDVVGVSNNGGGRFCTTHQTCGDSVVVSNKLYCVWKVQPNNDNPKLMEEVVKVYKIDDDGLARCHVGYLPRRYFHRFNPLWFDEMYLRVKEDLRLSSNNQELSRSVKNCGIVVCEIIKNNLRYNSYNPLEEPCEVSSIDSETIVPPNLKKVIMHVQNSAKANKEDDNMLSDGESSVKVKKNKKINNQKNV